MANDARLLFNRSMNQGRTAVEWSYKDVKQQFTSQDFKRSLKCRKAPIAIMYLSSVLLWNFRVLFYGGGQVGVFSNVNLQIEMNT